MNLIVKYFNAEKPGLFIWLLVFSPIILFVYSFIKESFERFSHSIVCSIVQLVISKQSLREAL
jgi:hypothetical protein